MVRTQYIASRLSQKCILGTCNCASDVKGLVPVGIGAGWWGGGPKRSGARNIAPGRPKIIKR